MYRPWRGEREDSIAVDLDLDLDFERDCWCDMGDAARGVMDLLRDVRRRVVAWERACMVVCTLRRSDFYLYLCLHVFYGGMMTSLDLSARMQCVEMIRLELRFWNPY